MNGQDKIKALNIVFVNWIKPTLKIKLNALKKIQRFCRRGSGAHAHTNMICNNVLFSKVWLFEPPVLYRQVCSCPDGECKSIPIRIYNKHKRMRYAINKIFTHDKEKGYDFKCPTDNRDTMINNIAPLSNQQILFKYYTSIDSCYCNKKPLNVYKRMIKNPGGNLTSKNAIKYIMCELSGDELTYYTRFKLSQFLVQRLS